MIRNRERNEFLDRWGQAKYSMEVFAAMLGEKDTMRIYYMSDFDTVGNRGGATNAHQIEIRGSEPARDRVARIHNTITVSLSTPFDPVVKAHEDLLASNADEKWLVILTDGAFTHINGVASEDIDVKGTLTQYASNSAIDLILFAIGDDEDLEKMMREMTSGGTLNFTVKHARNTNDILREVTTISNQIFSRDILPLTNAARHEFEIDIPMLDIIVFAQGPDARIGSITGDSTHAPVETVNVRYSDTAIPAGNTFLSNERNRIIISSDLVGIISTFRDIPVGSFSIDIEGARTVDVYYQPKVDVGAFLTDAGGNEVPDPPGSALKAGEYTLNLCFVESGTNNRLPNSRLLGDVSFSATIISNNAERDRIYSHGDKIDLEDGLHIVRAEATYLGIHTVRSEVPIPVREEFPVVFRGEALYSLTEFGFDDDSPFSVSAKIQELDSAGSVTGEREFTADEWNALSTLSISGGNNLSFRIEKGSIGELVVYPSFTGSTRGEAEAAFGTQSPKINADSNAAGIYFVTREHDAHVNVHIESGYRQVTYTPVSVPTYEITRHGISNDDVPIIVQAKVEGREITAEQWEMMELLPAAKAETGNIGEFRVEKTQIPGQYALYPTLYRDSITRTEAVNAGIEFTYTERVGAEVWTGDGLGEGGLALSMTDTRSWIEKNPILALCLLILLLLLILLIWIMTRKALPKRVELMSSKFSVSGHSLERSRASLSYSRKRRELYVESPKYPAEPKAQSKLTLSLEPVDRRYKKSSQRGIIVTGITAPQQVHQINIGKPYVRGKEKGSWEPVGAVPGKVVPLKQRLSSTIIMETVEDSTLTCTIKRR